MIGPVVTLIHFGGLGTEGEGQHLMAKADAEDGLAAGDQGLDFRHRILASRCRIAGAVGQHDTVWIARQNVGGAGVGGHDRDVGPDAGQGAQNVALNAIVDDHDLIFGLSGLGIALWPSPKALVEGEGLAAACILGQIQTDNAAPRLGLGGQSF